MKSTAFDGKYMTLASCAEYETVERIEVPTLSAYAIEYSEFTPPPNLDVGHILLCQYADYEIEGDHVIFKHPFPIAFGGMESCRLVIHYHGIRDFSLLFPQVSDSALQERLGRFYEEAEKAFEHGAWLSFALMASAVYEGLLVWRLPKQKDNFSSLIKSAGEQDIISQNEVLTLERARSNRNLIHASRYTESWISRSSAMDIRTVMNRLVRELSAEVDRT